MNNKYKICEYYYEKKWKKKYSLFFNCLCEKKNIIEKKL